MFHKKSERSHSSDKNYSRDAENTKKNFTAIKDISVKPKTKWTDAAEHRRNIEESSNPYDTEKYEIEKVPSMIFNTSFKKIQDVPKLPIQIPNSIGSINSCHSIAANILAIKNNLSCLKGSMKVLKNDLRRCSSLTDSRKIEEELCCASSHTKNSISLAPQTFDFEYISSDFNAKHFDYVKEFDSVLNKDVYSDFQKSYRSSENPKDIFSLTPTISPSVKPVTLKKRTYTYGIVSIDDSAIFSSATASDDNKQKDANEIKTKPEHEENDVYYSSEEDSEARDMRNLASDNDKTIYPSECKKELGENTLLIIKPLRIKCTDEATKRAKEIVVYSDDFIASLRKKNGGKFSEREIFESLIQQCTDYEGKSLRVILDTKRFINGLPISKKQKNNNKWNSASASKIIKRDLGNSARNEARTQKVSNAIPRSMSYGTILNERISNKSKKSFIQQLDRDAIGRNDKVKKSSKPLFPTKASTLNSPDKKVTRAVSVKSYVNERNRENGKSRISIKRVNVGEIISSKFKKYFNFYAKFRSRLKCGIAISKINSNFWLKTCGIINDANTEKLADDYFDAVAKSKCILNISDYIQFLTKFAKNQRLFLLDIIEKLMSRNIDTSPKINCVLKNDSPG